MKQLEWVLECRGDPARNTCSTYVTADSYTTGYYAKALRFASSEEALSHPFQPDRYLPVRHPAIAEFGSCNCGQAAEVDGLCYLCRRRTEPATPAPRAVEPPCAHSKAGSCTACMFEAQHREGYAVAEPVRKRKGAVAPAKWEDIPLDPPVGDWVSGKEHALVKAERDDLRVDLDRLIDGRWKPADLLQANADLRTHVARLERSLDLAQRKAGRR